PAGFQPCYLIHDSLETAPEISVGSRLPMARIARTCSTIARGTKNPGINMNGNLPNIRLGTSAWIRFNGPDVVSTARVTTFASASSPRTFQRSASLIPNRPRVDNQAIKGAEAPI